MKPLQDTIFLQGEKIALATLKESHIRGLVAIAKNPLIWQHLPIAGWQKPVFDAWLLETLHLKKMQSVHPFVVLDKNTGEILGTSRFQDIYLEHRKLDIGWTWFTPSVWGSGVNMEAKSLMLHFAFETFGAVRVGFKVDEKNIRSQRALEKIGAIREGVFRKHMIRPDGSARTSYFYSITDDDWQIVKYQLKRLNNPSALILNSLLHTNDVSLTSSR
jgi:RimJ/RimL family protein N-acetyltransferase